MKRLILATCAVMFAASRPQAQQARPVIAILADAGGTEITDYMIPRATLIESGVATVMTVATHLGKIKLIPGTIAIDPDLTLAAFDAANPRGADYVIVPAIVNRDDAVIATWLREQAARGATIVSVCEGAWVLAHAGLLDKRSATSHWHALPNLAEQYPNTRWVRNQRYVVDGRVITTTGVSASLPASIYLVERIAGRAVADSVARRIGLTSWDTAHDTDAYHIARSMYVIGVWDYVAWWRHDRVAIPLADGFDEIALALSVDAISRTIRGKPFTWSSDGAAVRGRQGMRVAVDQSRPTGDVVREIALPSASRSSAGSLDSVIARLAQWYGPEKAALIEMGMEYPHARNAR